MVKPITRSEKKDIAMLGLEQRPFTSKAATLQRCSLAVAQQNRRCATSESVDGALEGGARKPTISKAYGTTRKDDRRKLKKREL